MARRRDGAREREGAFKYVDRPHTPGPRWYRAVARDSGRPGAVTSRPVRVTVLAWTDLVTHRSRRTDNVKVWTDVRIKSHEFARSVSSYRGAASGSADWNLPSDCTKLRVRIGAGDDSDEGAVAHIVLRGDRTPLFSGSFILTQSTVRTFDVSDVFRLEFSWSSTVPGSVDPAPGAQAVLASPQLLCAS